MPPSLFPSSSKQTGASSIEFVLMATVFCALLLLCYDATRAWMLRQVLLLALQESGRSGVTQHLHPSVMQQRFDYVLAAWWTSAQQQQHYYAQFSSRYGFSPWRMWLLSPSDQDFTQHQDKSLSLANPHGYKHINVQHQWKQHLTNAHPTHQQSIFGANTLRTQLIYWYEPSLALSRSLLRLTWPHDADPYLQQGKSQGLVPIRLQFSLPMQSHPIQWPLHPHHAIQRLPTIANAAQTDPVRAFTATGITTFTEHR